MQIYTFLLFIIPFIQGSPKIIPFIESPYFLRNTDSIAHGNGREHPLFEEEYYITNSNDLQILYSNDLPCADGGKSDEESEEVLMEFRVIRSDDSDDYIYKNYNSINPLNGRSQIHEIICNSDKKAFDRVFFHKRYPFQRPLYFDTLDLMGMSPLMDAILRKESNEMAKIIIANTKLSAKMHRKIQVDPFFNCESGFNAIHFAVFNNRPTVVHAIIDHLGDANIIYVLFTDALVYRKFDILALLFKKGKRLAKTDLLCLDNDLRVIYDNELGHYLAATKGSYVYFCYRFDKIFNMHYKYQTVKDKKEDEVEEHVEEHSFQNSEDATVIFRVSKRT